MIRVLIERIAYPNGLELTSDGKNLLVAETGRARILRLLQALSKLILSVPQAFVLDTQGPQQLVNYDCVIFENT